MAENHKFTIDRDRWQRGAPAKNGLGDELRTQLLSSKTGKMCCLGFFLESCGMSLFDIEDKASPDGLSAYVIPTQASWLLERNYSSAGHHNSKSCGDLMCINDSEKSFRSEEDRESDIRDEFLRNRVEVEFIGGEVAKDTG